MRFSQHQEHQADRAGLEHLLRRYGHAGGATSFYRRLAQKEGGGELAWLFASHPYPEERVEAIEEAIRANGYRLLRPEPLEDAFGKVGPAEGSD